MAHRGCAWPEAVALSPPPPDDGPFVDIASAQADVRAQLQRARRPEGWLFERRQYPVAEATTAADPHAHRGSAPWLPWLCQLGEVLRCVRVAPRPETGGEVRAELGALSSADVSVRLVDEARAARAIVPDVLVLGRTRAYALVYDYDVLVGATVVDDLTLVGRWRTAIARLHANGASLDGRAR